MFDGLIPVADRLVVRRATTSEKTASGLHLPQTARDKQKPDQAEILAVGPGRMLDNGTLVKVSDKLAVGKTIIFTRYSGSEVSIDGDDVLVIRESDVLAVVNAKNVSTEQRDFTHAVDGSTPSLKQYIGEARTEIPEDRKSFPVS